uniref:NADH-ubiquinone oxidoreductase chain 6 n=1 Tax=Dexiogyia corticina TaxID=347336 RepID=A0A0S2M790_9COLE|nr:NADH deshydrogenase subunit 6 [Dexiogyia corticina]
MFMLMSFIISISFMFLNHPLSMGMMLLVQTILICLITGMLNSSFWFSYILFLIMIGGMLVLFIYMTSIASNEMFKYSNNLMMMIFFMVIYFFIMNTFLDSYFMNMMFIFKENVLFTLNFLPLTKYFNYPSMMMIFLMIIYLFITLIAIVKITKIEFGPLRQKF